MTEIRQSEPATAERPRARWLRPAVAGPALAGALALAVIGGIAVAGSGDGSGTQVGKGGTASYDFAPNVGQDTTGGAPRLLSDIAAVAQEIGPEQGIRDDQYVYIKSKIAYAVSGEGPTKLDPLHVSESWTAVDGTREGLERENGHEEPIEPDPAAGEPGHERSTNYRFLSTLPTDPETMLKWLRTNAAKSSGQEPDQAAFVMVGDLIRESLVPPRVNAALYRAVARIPDVVVVPDAVNAVGRHGIAVARVDEENHERTELIFDKKTKKFIGERSVALAPSHGTEIGQVLGTTAILQRAVVDKAGQRP